MKTDSILNHVRVASPCNARWEDMTGDDRSRFCQRCQKHVFNLSAMTQAEAEAFVRETEGKFCGRFHRRHDGRMLTADCPTGRRIRRDRVARWCGAAFAAVMVFLGGRLTLRSAESKSDGSSKPHGGSKATQPPALLGEVNAEPPVMGDIAVSTNIPPATNPPAIMGKVCIPPPTNPPPPAAK